MSKVIAITGASAGIGHATALRLARDGASIAAYARRADRLSALTAEIVNAGGRAVAVVGDVADESGVNGFVLKALETFGRLDVMICNAGFGLYGAVDEVTPARMRQVLEVNYMGTYLAIRAALTTFRRQGHGHLIVISSIVGQRGVPFVGAYAATKFAQVGLAECLRAELVGSNIHLTVVYPISTETEFFSVMARESGFATRAAGPRQRASDVADAIAAVIERPRAEVYPYRKARWLAILNAMAPGFCDRLVKRWGREAVVG
jgi:NADP-dependent 3-hydroxy acid dehydrogenase YdfG